MDYPLNEQSTGYSIDDVTKREDYAELIDGILVVTDKTSAAHNNAVSVKLNILKMQSTYLGWLYFYNISARKTLPTNVSGGSSLNAWLKIVNYQPFMVI